MDIRVHERNFEAYPIQKLNKHHYELVNQPVLFREEYSPSKFDRFPLLFNVPERFYYEGYDGQYTNWNEYGKWISQELLSNKGFLDGQLIKRDLEGVISNSGDKREIIKDLYNYLQENTRYISIGLDEGGLVPLSANKVHDVKYGDCKALSFYMINLLSLYDIQANYVEVYASSSFQQDLFSEFACPAPGNHIIVNVPFDKDTIWLDCTSNSNPFNFLGDFTDDRIAVQISEDGGHLVRTPRYGKDLNKNKVNGEVILDKNGDIKADLTISDHGLRYGIGVELSKKDEKDFNKYLSQSLLAQFDKLQVQSRDLSLDKDAIESKQQYSFTAAGYGEIAGSYMILNASLLGFMVPRLKKDSNRENEIIITRSAIFESDIIYHLPLGHRWDIPDEIKFESAFGVYSQSVSKEGDNKFLVHRKFELNKGKYPSNKYNEIKNFFDRIRKAEKTKFSTTNKS